MEAAGDVVQRLIRLGRRIENFQPRRPERDTLAGFNPYAGVVRPPVPQRGTRPFERIRLHRASVEPDNPTDSAHLYDIRYSRRGRSGSVRAAHCFRPFTPSQPYNSPTLPIDAPSRPADNGLGIGIARAIRRRRNISHAWFAGFQGLRVCRKGFPTVCAVCAIIVSRSKDSGAHQERRISCTRTGKQLLTGSWN